jgi:hypothetical protein
MPSNLAALAPSGRVMAAVPPNLAAMTEAGRGEPYLGQQAVLVADQAVANFRPPDMADFGDWNRWAFRAARCGPIPVRFC